MESLVMSCAILWLNSSLLLSGIRSKFKGDMAARANSFLLTSSSIMCEIVDMAYEFPWEVL